MQQNNQKVEDGPIVVTGASGGVGSFAVDILHKLGYEVYCGNRYKSCA